MSALVPMSRPQLLDHTGRPIRSSRPALRAGHDAARTTDENRRHWNEADSLEVNSQLTPDVRRRLRNRARYEALNNCYMAGLIRTLVNDTVGTGPRLQMLTPDPKLNASIQDLWRVWAAAADWALTCRVNCGVRYLAGECFGVFRDSKRLEQLGLPVTLDLRLLEPDQVTDGYSGMLFNTKGDDGIVCDDDGDVVGYRILKRHPGDNRPFGFDLRPETIDARNVTHWYVPERPGQLRGYPPVAPALPIFAQLRRFTQATLTAAEVAAMLAGVLELPEAQPDTGAPEVEYETMDTIELVRGMLLTVPAGGKVTQFKPEQPTTNHQAFIDVKLRECGRVLNVPFGKMAGDHSKYNYSSGRLDDNPYWDDRDIERQAMEAKFFNPALYRWYEFAKYAIPGLIAYEGQWWKLNHCWHYRAKPTADPVKDGNADEINLTNATDDLAAIAARDGTTVEALLDGRKRVLEMFQERGLPLPPWLTGQSAPIRVTEAPSPATPAQGVAHAA
jgi:capsid protein